jgi:hypothetical protein
MSHKNFLSKKKPHEILEVTENASEEVIRKSYKRLVMIWHPDRNPAPEASSRTAEINQALQDILKAPTTADAIITEAMNFVRSQYIQLIEKRNNVYSKITTEIKQLVCRIPVDPVILFKGKKNLKLELNKKKLPIPGRGLMDLGCTIVVDIEPMWDIHKRVPARFISGTKEFFDACLFYLQLKKDCKFSIREKKTHCFAKLKNKPITETTPVGDSQNFDVETPSGKKIEIQFNDVFLFTRQVVLKKEGFPISNDDGATTLSDLYVTIQ